MPAYLVIEDGKVANIVLAELTFAMENGWIDAQPGVNIGWSYDEQSGEFSPPAPSPEPVPETVTMRQAKIQLSRAGLLAKANAAIEAMEGQAGEEARLEWEYATELRRDHPLVAGIGRALGLDEAAKDDLFRQAAAIA